jgi:hypothetical protein
VPLLNCTEQCTCLPGWTGAACASCAPPPPGLLVDYLCVGLVPARTPAAYASHAHVLALVEPGTVFARLAGTYYAPGQGQAADLVPGTGLVDCWCLTLANAIPHQGYDSHAAATAAATSYLADRDVLLAVALPDPAGPAPPPTAPPPSAPPPTAPPPTAPPPPPSSGVGPVGRTSFVALLFSTWCWLHA